MIISCHYISKFTAVCVIFPHIIQNPEAFSANWLSHTSPLWLKKCEVNVTCFGHPSLGVPTRHIQHHGEGGGFVDPLQSLNWATDDLLLWRVGRGYSHDYKSKYCYQCNKMSSHLVYVKTEKSSFLLVSSPRVPLYSS